MKTQIKISKRKNNRNILYIELKSDEKILFIKFTHKDYLKSWLLELNFNFNLFIDMEEIFNTISKKNYNCILNLE